MKMCLSKDGFVQVRQKREDSFRFGEKRNPGRISAAGNLSLGSFFTAPFFGIINYATNKKIPAYCFFFN